MLTLYSGLNLRGGNGDRIPASCRIALGQKEKYSKLQQGDGVILNGQSAEIDDRASAANGVPA
jgi:hypothetical protein